jgi:hypothetical protein
MARDLVENQTPTKPSLPPRLKPLVTAPQADSFGPYGWEPRELPWSPPAKVDPNDAGLARSMIPAYEAYLEPAGVQWISGRIATVLGHYFVGNTSQPLGAAVFRDWIDILGDLPAHAIQEACLKWLRTEPRRRPGPGDIRELALRLVDEEAKTLKRLRALVERGDLQNPKTGGVVTTLARHLDRNKGPRE